MPEPVNQNHYSLVYNRLSSALDRVYPQRCRGCAGAAGREAFCPPCRAELPWLGPACPICARPQPAATPCGGCLRRPPPYQACLAAFRYAAPVDHLIKGFKFNGDLAAGRDLAALLGRCLAAGADLPEAIVPMPLHPSRQRRRGFNQALELARQLGHQLELPLLGERLRRTRPTAVQSELPARRRGANVRNAFACRELSGHVALVDDVYTTGHTVAAAASALRRAGASRVDVWVIARAGR